MSWWKDVKKKVKKAWHHTAKMVGLKDNDLSAIALSPFTAGASLAGTSAAKNMLQNPMGTIQGGITGYETAGPIGALLGAVDGGGGFDSPHSSKSEADKAIKEQYEYQLALQKNAQQWQEGMSNTAHQREVTDLKEAGLNPVLSAGGSGASTGSVGAGSVGMPDKVAEKTAMLQNKIAEVSLKNELANSAKQRELAQAQTEQVNAETMRTIGMTPGQIKNLSAEYESLIANAKNAKSQAELAEAEKKILEWEGKHPVLTKLLPGMAAMGGAMIGGAIGGPVGAFTGFSAGQLLKNARPIGFRN